MKKANRMMKWADALEAMAVALAILMAVCWVLGACNLHVGHPEQNGLFGAMMYAGAICFVVALWCAVMSSELTERGHDLMRKARREAQRLS